MVTGFARQYGSVFRMFLGHRPYVMLTGAEGFEAILSSNKHITKGPDYRCVCACVPARVRACASVCMTNLLKLE